MKVKVVKHNFRESSYCYEVFSSSKRKLISGDVWKSEEIFYPSPYLTEEQAKNRAIKHADELLITNKPIKKLKLDETIYVNEN